VLVRSSALLLLIAACSSTQAPKPPAAPVLEQALTSNIDLLVVMQNSHSMGDKQSVFAANFPKLVQAFDAFPTGRPNLHVGIVTTTIDIGVDTFGPGCPSPDPNEDGLLQNTPRITGCSPPTGRFIIDVANGASGRSTNYTGTLDAAFSCVGQVGATGCGFEAPLEAMKRALDGSRPENAGFLRDDAYLVVVFLGDDDDCSADPALFELSDTDAGYGDFRCTAQAYDCDRPISTTVAGTYRDCQMRVGSRAYLHDPIDYVHFLETIKPPGQVLVATIVGPPSTTLETLMLQAPAEVVFEPSCLATINGNPSGAAAGTRLGAFAEDVGPGRGQRFSICQSDFASSLTAIGDFVRTASTGCVLGPLPTGTAACVVEDDTTQLPACTLTSTNTVDPSSQLPCWYMTAEPVACATTETQLQVHVERATPPPAGTLTHFHCGN